ncbi:MAG: four helix bundle protein [Bacteroidales bacterium]|nr:four helix bundle protein [Bacteroidales bacterium]
MANQNGYKDLIVYKKAFQLSMDIFEISKSFPTEERYSLTDQIRRSSRSVGAQIAEGWPKRRYIKSFVSKLVDSQGEACETTHWLDVSLAANYISNEKHLELNNLCIEIQKMLESMIKTPEKFCK